MRSMSKRAIMPRGPWVARADLALSLSRREKFGVSCVVSVSVGKG